MAKTVHEALEHYALAHTSEPEQIFAEMVTAAAQTGWPGMLSGPMVGRFLQALVRISSARKILEVGCFVGYSTLAMASAAEPGARVITCELSPEYSKIARAFWERHPAGERIEVRMGPALDALRGLDPGFDLIFIDADKENYPLYYEESMRLLSPRGLIVIDNALWGGQVLNPEDEIAKSISRCNDMAQADPRAENVLLTVRDGLMLVYKS